MSRYIYFRYLLCAPFTIITLAAFALYFVPRNAGYFQKGLPQIFWGATAGILTAVTNPIYNVVCCSFIWLELPPWRDDDGSISPFTTTRLDALRKGGDPLATHLAQVINTYDPGHFAD
jgi:hypothetical protein